MSATDSPIIDVDLGDSGGIQQLDHAVAGLPDGKFVITWVEFNTTNNTETIHGAIYNADGSISSDFVAGTRSGVPFLYGDVAALPNGQFIVAWQTDDAVHAQIFNEDGTTAVGEFSTGLLGSYPGLTALPNGDFVLVAPGTSGLVGGVFGPTGSPIAGTGFSIPATPQSFPKVTALPQGGFVVAWDQIPTIGQVDYYAEFFGPNGLPDSSGPIAVGSGSGGSTVSVAALPDGNIVFTWQAYNNIPQVMARVVTSNGTPLTSAFTVSSNLGLEPTPAVTSLPNGNFVIVWTTSNQNASGNYVGTVQGQLYTSGGSAIGSAFTINSSTTSDQEYYGYPNVAALADGRIVVDWETTLPSGLTNTYAQIVNLPVASGLALPNEFVPYSDKVIDQPTNLDVAAAAMDYAGHLWSTDNCTGLVWAVAESVGATFWDLKKQLIGTSGQQQYVEDPLTDPLGGYVIPNPQTLPQTGDILVKGDWVTKAIVNWQSVVQIGDLVRLPAEDFIANDGIAGAQTTAVAGHSFIVVGGNKATGWIVIDDTPSSTPGTMTIQPHTLNSLVGTFADDVLNSNAIAYVSRLVNAPNSFYAGATLTGTVGEPITYGNSAAFLDGSLLQHESIMAGNGSDVVMGGSFNNIVLGNGNDTVNAGNSDTISLGNGADEVSAGAQTVVKAGNGSDEVTCGANSTIKLGNGTDTINAGAGSTVFLGNGQDSVAAGPSATVTVGNGGDTLYAAPGDIWNIGKGQDTFVFEPGFGQNTISGFSATHDTIQFDHTLFSSFAAVMADAAQVGSNTVISLDSNDSITLVGVHLSTLTAAVFKFS